MPTTDEAGLRARTEAEAVADIVKKGALAPAFHTVESEDDQPNAQLITYPAGTTVGSLKKYLDEVRLAPDRRKGTAELTNLQSFIDHVKRFAGDDTVLFASDERAAPVLLAVLNYNGPGPEGEARFGDYRARYAFPLSDAWIAWTGANKRWMKLEEFALFLEEHLVDVVAASGAAATEFSKLYECKYADASRLLALSKGLSLRVNSKVEHHKNLSTGEGQVVWAEEHQAPAGAPLNIPGAFTVGIPIFRNGTPYVMPVRLRYRVAGGSILWSYDMHRIDATFEDAVRLAGEKAMTDTGRPLLYGKPEV